MSHSAAVVMPRPTHRCPGALITAIRAAVSAHGTWQEQADRVAAVVRGNLPCPSDLLTPGQLTGDPACYQTHLVHAEQDGSFSICAMVWLPGQRTPIHDHVSWCVTAVLRGDEYEEVYALDGDHLKVVLRNQNPPGTVIGYAPPGDIHQVTNRGAGLAVSLHVYGTDITRVGNSIRRIYDLPVR